MATLVMAMAMVRFLQNSCKHKVMSISKSKSNVNI